MSLCHAALPTLCRLLVVTVLALLGGCGGGGSGSGHTTAPVAQPTPPFAPPAEPTPVPPEPTPSECSASYDGVFDAIQELVFVRHGCAADACHGSARAGGLDLRPEAAYASLIEVPSTGDSLPLVVPGDNDRSYLWRKLAAKTRPGSVEVGGSPMPVGTTTLSEDELELVRVWIKGGAPETGTVFDADSLVDGCLPEPEPITIRPLEPPPAGEGIQLVMPPIDLPAGSEREVCFAQYYDVSDEVPPEFLDETGTKFRFSISDLRQDPQSHHLNLLRYEGDAPLSAFGDFTCRGGERDGGRCVVTNTDACGEGFCVGPIVDSVGCTDFAPSSTREFSLPQVLVAQQAQERQELPPGAFAELPVRGLWVWNSHAFNLSSRDHVMHARINYWFATEQVHRAKRIIDSTRIFAQQTPPFASETVCAEVTLPRGSRLVNLIAHTHKRGKRFWVELADGSLIYESFVYNDPVNQYYEPPLAFDSRRSVERTLHYCAVYVNGLTADGSPDPATVRRSSITPENSLFPCEPIACTAGRVAEPCSGVDDDAACDRSPGAGDGECDACVLTGGNSTEDEMLVLLGAYYVEQDD